MKKIRRAKHEYFQRGNWEHPHGQARNFVEKTEIEGRKVVGGSIGFKIVRGGGIQREYRGTPSDRLLEVWGDIRRLVRRRCKKSHGGWVINLGKARKRPW